ncbi:unnamed protein product [Linum trigynum]|uniref:Uncharacterized protein n=1 Tax=Linum trigynum TaxID=586398 RepID=A0AAV2EVG3_9ROSI
MIKQEADWERRDAEFTRILAVISLRATAVESPPAAATSTVYDEKADQTTVGVLMADSTATKNTPAPPTTVVVKAEKAATIAVVVPVTSPSSLVIPQPVEMKTEDEKPLVAKPPTTKEIQTPPKVVASSLKEKKQNTAAEATLTDGIKKEEDPVAEILDKQSLFQAMNAKLEHISSPAATATVGALSKITTPWIGVGEGCKAAKATIAAEEEGEDLDADSGNERAFTTKEETRAEGSGKRSKSGQEASWLFRRKKEQRHDDEEQVTTESPLITSPTVNQARAVEPQFIFVDEQPLSIAVASRRIASKSRDPIAARKKGLKVELGDASSVEEVQPKTRSTPMQESSDKVMKT